MNDRDGDSEERDPSSLGEVVKLASAAQTDGLNPIPEPNADKISPARLIAELFLQRFCKLDDDGMAIWKKDAEMPAPYNFAGMVLLAKIAITLFNIQHSRLPNVKNRNDYKLLCRLLFDHPKINGIRGAKSQSQTKPTTGAEMIPPAAE